jgi:uncharacterized membrane protein YfcA
VDAFLTGLVVFAAAFTQGVVGFGFGLVTMALLPLFLPERFAIAFVAVYACTVAAQIAWRVRAHIRWSAARPILIGIVLGVPLGVAVVNDANPLTIKAILGITLILYCGWALTFGARTRPRRLNPAWGYLAGALSGILGAFNTGGPPAVVYTTVSGWDKDTTTSSLQLTFVLTSIIQLTAFAFTGVLTSDSLLQNLYFLPVMVLGVAVGQFLYQRIDQATFRRGLLSVLLAVGVVYVHKSFFSA